MKKFLVWIFSIVFVFTMVGLSTGCKAAEESAEGVEESTEEAGESVEEVEEVETEKPTLVFWTASALNDIWLNFVEGFEEETGYKLDIIPLNPAEVLLTKWAAGERPDILGFHMMKNWYTQLHPKENLFDLSDMDFATKTKFNMMDYWGDEEIWGPVLGAPSMWGWWYNKEIFEKNSLEIPGSFDEFYALCGTLKDLGITPLFGAAGDAWPVQLDPMLFQLDEYKNDPDLINDINTGKTTFNQPRFVEGLEAVQKLIDAGYYQENFLVGTYEESQKALIDGEVAMIANGDWTIHAMVQTYGEEEVNKKIGGFGCSMNSNAVGYSGYIFPNATYYVPKTGNAEKEEGAKEFIRYITGENYQKLVDDLGQISMLEGFEDATTTIEPIIEMREYFEEDNCLVWSQSTIVHYGAFEIFMQEMFAGTKTPEDVADALSEEFRKNAEAAGIEGF